MECSLSSLVGATDPRNKAHYAPGYTSGPTRLHATRVPNTTFIRSIFSPPIVVSLVDDFGTVVTVADGYNAAVELSTESISVAPASRQLRPLVSASLSDEQRVNLNASLLGGTQQRIGEDGTISFHTLQYGGRPDPGVEVLFNTSLVALAQRTIELSAVVTVNISGCPEGEEFFPDIGSCVVW